MSTPELALQIAIRQRIIAANTGVPASNILDRNQQPIIDPSIIIGVGQTVDRDDSIKRDLFHVWKDLHVWKKEPGLGGVQAIAGAIRKAIHSDRLTLASPFHCVDAYVEDMRFLRDPDGETSHAVVTIKAIVQEAAP